MDGKESEAMSLKMKRSEAEVKKAIQDYLKAKGYMVFRMNAGAMFASYKGRTRKIQMNPAGTADLLVLTKEKLAYRTWNDVVFFEYNKVIWIEVKASHSGTMSKEQRLFQKMVKDEGHVYILARSVEDVMRVL